MKTVSDQTAIERILKTIAQDDELITQFAKVVGVSRKTFDKWIDTSQVPEPLPEKLFVVVRYTKQGALNGSYPFHAVCSTMDRAQAKVDDLTKEHGATFLIIEAPLNP
jgi:hypothetical protein